MSGRHAVSGPAMRVVTQGPAAGTLLRDRRKGYDRRKTSLLTFVKGGFTPRRRNGRRQEDIGYLVDWHEPHLLFMAITILLLSVTDAFLTLTLIMHGAEEVNPIMNYLLVSHPGTFAGIKMLLTGTGVLILVACARATVFRFFRVSTIMHWFLLGYVTLIAYESWLLRQVM